MANSNGWGDGSANNNIGWGQGAVNNNISWGKSQIDSWSGATDIDGGNPPVNSVAPAITGTAQEGQTLTCSTGTWSGTPTYTYQWKRNGSNIGSATNSTYTLVTADVGQSIKCTVTATNALGSSNADSNTVTPTSSTDADAQAFITAASITDPTQQAAINQLVVDLKGYGLWTNMKLFHPYVGGTNTTTTYNLKNPATFQMAWNGGWTWTNLGVTGSGSNNFGNTGFNMSTQISNGNNWSVGFYSNLNVSNAGIDFGADTGTSSFYLASRSTLLGNAARFQTTQTSSYSDPNVLGLYVGVKVSDLNQKIYKNGVEVTNTNYSSQVNTFYNGNVYLGALNRNGSRSFSTALRYACSFIYDGVLNATQNTNLYTAIQTFQTTLGRQV